jgi:hypothetical protein
MNCRANGSTTTGLGCALPMPRLTVSAVRLDCARGAMYGPRFVIHGVFIMPLNSWNPENEQPGKPAWRVSGLNLQPRRGGEILAIVCGVPARLPRRMSRRYPSGFR